MTKRQFLNHLFQTFGDYGVEYFVIGPFEELPDDTGGSDIDIVINDEYTTIVDSIIRGLIQQAENTCLASYYTNLNTRFYRILSMSWGVQIDIFHKGLCYKGIPYFPIELLWKDVVTHNGIVKVLPKVRGYYVDFFKELIHTGKVKEKYVTTLLNSMTHTPKTYIAEIEQVYGKRSAELLRGNQTIQSISELLPELRSAVKSHLFKGRYHKLAMYLYASISRLLKQKPGHCIAFLGTDGSGKSTIINEISPILNEGFHDGVVYHHLRPSLLPDLGVLFGKKQKSCGININPHGKKPSGTLGSLVRWGYYIIDYNLGYFSKIWRSEHTKSKVHIFDRYYYDYYIDPKRSRIKLPTWILRLGELFIHKPDIIFCLGGDPELIYARKPETSYEEVKRQTEELQRFCRRHRSAVWIDTTLTIENSYEECMRNLIKKFDCYK